MRTRELRDIAASNNLSQLHLPKVFEVRWTEFTYDLLNSVLTSWHALVLYFQSSKDNAARGFLTFLTNSDNVQLLVYLADTLAVFSRYQKQLQSDSTTILDVDSLTTNVKLKLGSLKDTALLGGWVSQLQEQIKYCADGQMHLKDVQLQSTVRRRSEHHRFITDHRDISAVKNEITECLIEFLSQRFSTDTERLTIIKPFATLQVDANLKDVHNIIASDLDLEQLGLEYDELMDMDNITAVRKLPLREVVSLLASSNNYTNVTIALARILAAKPHSADVERLISCSNLLKSPDRSRMYVDTENLYLFVYYNMPPLYEWNPKPAVLLWLRSKERRYHTDRPKGKEQPYFRGVFAEASKLSKGIDDDHDQDGITFTAANEVNVKSKSKSSKMF